MTKISDIYDAFITEIESKLTDYERIPNPYDAEANNQLFLSKGYGLAFGPGENTQRFVGCKLSIAREFIVILINQVTTTDHNVSERATIEKALFEDQLTLVEGLEKDPTLSTNIINLTFLSDTGIELLRSENSKAKFYGLQFSFEAEYTENIT